MIENIFSNPDVIMAIIAFVAIVSPIVTAVINNCHQTKIKKLDMYEEAKRNALSNFINSAQATIFNSEDPEIMLQYSSNFDKLFIYFSKISLDTIKPFDSARVEVNKNNTPENFKKANNELSKIVITLAKQINKK